MAKQLSPLQNKIAQLAADLLLEEGNHNVQTAKVKAAKAQGYYRPSDLPSNQSIDKILLEKQQQKGFSKQPNQLLKKRRMALIAMKNLLPLESRLTGSVASGTADLNSNITLHIFSETAEEIIFHLLNSKIPWQEHETTFQSAKGKKERHLCFSFIADNQPIYLIWFQPKQLREKALLSNNTEPEIRMKLAKLQKILH